MCVGLGLWGFNEKTGTPVTWASVHRLKQEQRVVDAAARSPLYCAWLIRVV
jgi:hypothetical protein